ncbi:hypothetical protein A1Q1_03374 [Trichosporon asahii var. asahii CBS 2479]|uniref:Major facilitator superfamily (MFS) profile domain-containing protein n=1 Tax=Trichosporon asahii var. asahii (strain ATCC 90039 / CBS 2479 / JCM 2466 / KCTC 7840 / NBRC 103889/ NCYC 2677 / UAMH 7654) TaxID=1186058 RepID=J6FBT0_TRIAS|nr:hypothetical protein A1Q1_03374 [Trichosporon asahii var. asahii CBS 2479]EJT52572.1 hypothetical protein A1Q1_03374 [Trichosporon asahii var. asahii CBS 2479]
MSPPTQPAYAAIENPGLRKMMTAVVMLYFNAWTWGYDGTLLNAFQAMPVWQQYFNHPTGGALGIIAAIFYLPAIGTPFIGSFLGDRIGRRATLFGACLFSIAGALLTTFATGRGMLIAGRGVMGAALGVQSTIGPPFMQEICHPRLRARAAAMWFITYQAGTCISAWICFGTLSWQSQWSWRLPSLFQITGTALICIYTLLGQMPESPRFLVSKGKEAAALKTLADLHANGEQDDPLVQYELQEIKLGIEMDKHYSSSYLDLVRTPGNRKRIFVLLFIAVSGQFAGNALVSYYLTPILELVGISNPRQISGINGGLAIFSTLNSALAAQFVERWGRRPLWLSCMSGVLVCFVIITGLSGGFDATKNPATGIALVPFLYLYFMFYNAGWITNGALYTVEILPYSIRAKALSLYVCVQTLAIAFNSYVNPIGLERIGWKYYLVFVVCDAVWLIIAYFFLQETKGYTLEEVTRLFDGKEAADNVADTAHDLEVVTSRKEEIEKY